MQTQGRRRPWSRKTTSLPCWLVCGLMAAVFGSRSLAQAADAPKPPADQAGASAIADAGVRTATADQAAAPGGKPAVERPVGRKAEEPEPPQDWRAAALRTPPPRVYRGGDFWQRDTLTGDWGGTRNEMTRRGFTADFSLTQIFQGVARGEERLPVQQPTSPAMFTPYVPAPPPLVEAFAGAAEAASWEL